MVRTFKARFSAGELAPETYALIDTQAFASGAKKVKNFYIKAHGGLVNREGLEFIGVGRGNNLNASLSSDIRLFPFQFSEEDSYALEFGHRYMRVIRNGGHVLETKITNDTVGSSLGIDTITQENPAFITMDANHGYEEGETIKLYGSYRTGDSGDVAFNEINERIFYVTEPTNDGFYLRDAFGTFLNTLPYSQHVAGTGSCIRMDLLPVLTDKIEAIETVAFGDDNRTRFKATAHGKANGEWVQVYGAYRYVSGSSGDTTPFVEMNDKIGIIADHTTDYFYLKKMDGSYWDFSDYSAPEDTGSFYVVYTKTMPYTASDLPLIKYSQVADVMTLTHPNHPPRKLTRQGHAIWRIEEIDFQPTIGKPTNVVPQATHWHSVNIDGITNASNAVINLPNGADGRWTKGSACEFGFMVGMTELEGKTIVLDNINDATNRLYTMDYTLDFSNVDTSSFGTFTSGGLRGDTLYRYAVSAVGQDGKEGRATSSSVVISKAMSEPYDSGTSAPKIKLTWGAVDGASSYRVYRQGEVSNGSPSAGALYGYIGESLTTSFVDQNIVPNFERTPQTFYNPFKSALGEAVNFPVANGFFEQRRVFGGSYLNPQVLWLSRSGEYDNYDRSYPVQADDSIDVRIASMQVNRIKHIIPLSTMLVATAGGFFQIQGGEASAITPTNIQSKQQVERGISDLEPLIRNGDVLYNQSRGDSVVGLSFNWVKDSYTATNISRRSEHLLRGHKIKEWAFSDEPRNVIYAIRTDGKLLMLTYANDVEVIGWSWGESVGNAGRDRFESVCSVWENGENILYFVMTRYICNENGCKYYKYVERMRARNFLNDEGIPEAKRGVFLDSSFVYQGDPIGILRNLDHLEGCTVTVLADGGVLEPMVVKDGVLELEREASFIVVGLAYESEVETLPLATASGQLTGKKKKISSVYVNMKDTKGIKATASSEKDFEEIRETTSETSEEPPLMTAEMQIQVQGSYEEEATVRIKQSYPLPAEILGVGMEVNAGDY